MWWRCLGTKRKGIKKNVIKLRRSFRGKPYNSNEEGKEFHGGRKGVRQDDS